MNNPFPAGDYQPQQRCDALSFGCLKCRLKIRNRIVPYLFLLMFNFCCKGMNWLCSLSAQSKECAKMKEKKQKELFLPALIYVIWPIIIVLMYLQRMLLLLSSFYRSLHKKWTYDKSQYLIYIVMQMSPSIVILEFSAVFQSKEL